MSAMSVEAVPDMKFKSEGCFKKIYRFPYKFKNCRCFRCAISIYIVGKAATICAKHTTELNAWAAVEGRIAPEMDVRR